MITHGRLADWREHYQAKRQVKLRNEFLSEAMEIVEKPASPLGAGVIAAVTAVVLFFTGWAVLGKMDEIVSARGKIVSVTGIQKVQAVNGGVVKEIYVEEGDHVEAGQELAVLDAAAYEITLRNTNRNIELLEYENALLSMLLEDLEITEPADHEDGEKAELRKYVKSLQAEYENQKEELVNVDQQLDLQLIQQNEALNSIKKEQENLKAQHRILCEAAEGKGAAEQSAEKIALAIAQKETELNDLKILYEAGAITRAEWMEFENELELLRQDYEIQKQSVIYEDYENSLQLLELEDELQRVDSEYATQREAVEIMKKQGEQSESDLAVLRANFEAKVNGMIVENQVDITNQRAKQAIQSLELVEQHILSPVSGTVKTLEITTEGGVMQAAQQIASIVPDDGQMIAEIQVLNKDIGYIEVGQDAAMKLDTYNFQKYGKLEGRVVNISPDALWDEQKGWVYMVKVAIDSENFGRAFPEATVGIGMEGTMEVKVADRAVIEFFLEPVVEYFDSSLKVR